MNKKLGLLSFIFLVAITLVYFGLQTKATAVVSSTDNGSNKGEILDGVFTTGSGLVAR